MKILKATIYRGPSGTDEISLTTDLPGATSGGVDPLYLRFHATRGYGMIYLNQYFPEIKQEDIEVIMEGSS